MNVSPATHPSLCEDLRRAGIAAGDSLIVHSSMKAIGPVEGGPQAVVASLLDSIGDTGTLLIPTFTNPQPDSNFDVLRTPSRLGLISETFRTTDAVQRSAHPTHAVSARGRHVEWLDGHHRVSGLGADSPLHRAAMGGAIVLMIGCGFTSCSVVHVAEAIVRVPYLGRVWYPDYDRPLTVTFPDGKRLTVPPLNPPTCSKAFDVLDVLLRARGRIRPFQFGQAACLAVTANEVISVAIELLQADAAALLCDRCAVCSRCRAFLTEPLAPYRS
jgi:aminoglycoside 3-N-acetyltransferase